MPTGTRQALWLLTVRIAAHHWRRCLAAAAGIAAACMLVFVQGSLFLGFTEAITALPRHAKADLWVAARGFRYIDQSRALSERDYYRIVADPDVAAAHRLILRYAEWRRPDGGQEIVQVIGFRPDADHGLPWNSVGDTAANLLGLGGMIVDAAYLKTLSLTGLGDRVEIQHKQARLVGMTTDIRSFTTAPILFTSYRDAQIFGWLYGDAITYILLRLVAGADLEAVRARLSSLGEYAVLTPDEVAAATRSYWMRATGAGITCLVGTLVGLGIAAVIIVQTLLSVSFQYATEFSTLRIIGARWPTITLVVMVQALGLGLAGLIPAALVAIAGTRWLRASGGAMLLPPWSLLAMTGAVVIFCVIGAGLPVTRMLAITRRKLV